jgi:3-oxoacyl-[acyl-carrier protein] reductase
MPELTGRNALITGGGRGIGRGIALTLAEAGANVALSYRRDEDAANATAEEARALGVEATTVQGDLASYEDCRRMVEEAVSAFGHIGILVNNGGIASRGQTIVDSDPAEMERVVRTHAFGSFYMTSLLLPQMRALDRGDIVMISSGAAQSLGPNGAPYNMGKAAQEAVAYTVAKEERQHNIHANVVRPGLVETEMGFRLARATRGISDMRELDERSPFGRVCQPEDIAAAVLYLVGESGSYVTNQALSVNGGGF